ncbi:MAG: hypothetical protein J0I23_09295 [Rhizobiales bacterium]|nr:hypothetical protein [Hyphomicrobiales bacterium]
MSSIPAPEVLSDLVKHLEPHQNTLRTKSEKYMVVLATLAKTALASGRKTAIQTGLTTAVAAAGLKTGVAIGVAGASVTFAPIGAALAPWFVLAEAGRVSTRVNGFIDLRDDANRSGPNSNSEMQYVCKCGKCGKNIGYIVDKEHARFARKAVYATLIGLVVLPFKIAHSVGKSFEAERPKEMTSRALVQSALTGCTVAIATIFQLVGDGTEEENKAKVVAIITSSDGWAEVKRLI